MFHSLLGSLLTNLELRKKNVIKKVFISSRFGDIQQVEVIHFKGLIENGEY